MPTTPHAHEAGFVTALCAALLVNAERVVVSDAHDAITGGQLMSRILSASDWLRTALDVGTGSVVAVTSANTVWGLALRYGAHLLGATACHLPFIGPDRQERLLDVIGPSTLVTDGTGPMVAHEHEWSSAVHVLPAAPRPVPEEAEYTPLNRYRDDDVCLLIASGGTTGIPKASYRTARKYSAMLDLPANHDRRQLVVTPLAYIAQTLVDETLVGGGSVVLGEHTWPVDRVVDAIDTHGITHMFVVEPALADLTAAAARPETRRRVGSLQHVFHLGASAPAGLRTRAHEVLGDAVRHGYAASELGPVSSTADREFNSATAGFIVPQVQCRIVGDDDADVPAGGVGTIVVKSPWISNGYWKAGPATEFAEWFRTTDQGRLSVDGELTIVGRRGDYLGTTGVHASEIEALASTVTGVEYAIVLAHTAGEHDATVVVQSRDPGTGDAVTAALAPFGDRVRLAVRVFERMPRTEQGKPDRLTLAGLLDS